MLGGNDNNNPVFPVLMEENRLQYDANTLTQLQLFQDTIPVGCNIDGLNFVGNVLTPTATNPCVKRSHEPEPEPNSRQQRYRISVNNSFHPDEGGNTGSILNPNPVSTGLRLSNEEDERNSSITSGGENMKTALPLIFSLNDGLKTEIDRQKEEFDHYITLQEERIVKGIRELKQRHTASFLNVLEKGVGRKLHEKELEIENMNRKNKELGERIKQVTMEAQTWHYRAKYNESIVNALRSNLQQVMVQGALQAKEGCGDSEVDDAASSANPNVPSSSRNPYLANNPLKCRACKGKEISVLLLPCRHLCLCKDCEMFVDICPVCKVMRNASVQVYMP